MNTPLGPLHFRCYRSTQQHRGSIATGPCPRKNHDLDGAAAAPAAHLVIHHLADQIVRRIIHAAGQLLRHGMLSAPADGLCHSLIVPVLARGIALTGT